MSTDLRDEITQWRQRISSSHRTVEKRTSEERAYREIYERVTADIGTDEDVEALRWVTQQHEGEQVLAAAVALDLRCEELLKARVPTSEYERAVEKLVVRTLAIRERWRKRESNAP